MRCISSSMEKGPCNVSAQSPPAENIEGSLSVKYDHRISRMMVIIKTPLAPRNNLANSIHNSWFS